MSKPHLETGSHTPGPWEVGPVTGQGKVIYADDVPFSVIAQMSVWLPDFANEQEANARLISAAPELAHGLRIAIDNLRALAIIAPDPAKVLAVADELEGVYAKATGAA